MDIENETLKVLKENAGGLTILELADSLKIHRHTLTKYIYKLEGEERIRVRRVGAAKLCYLSEIR